MDNDGSSNTTTKLRKGVTVIPTSAMTRCQPSVCSARARCDTAFSDTWNTVLVICAKLSDTMPMYCGRVVLQLVVHGDDSNISPVQFDKRSRVLSIDGKIECCQTIPACCGVCDGKGEVLSVSSQIWRKVIITN